MRTSFVRSLSPKPRHTSARKGRDIIGAAQGGSGSTIPDVELIHPGISDLDRETPSGNSTGTLGVVGAHLLRAARGARRSLRERRPRALLCHGSATLPPDAGLPRRPRKGGAGRLSG
jgi:hypothetical protein